jgi:hypothetical protein
MTPFQTILRWCDGPIKTGRIFSLVMSNYFTGGKHSYHIFTDSLHYANFNVLIVQQK